MTEPRISLCMIVKNEEKYLETCLKSVKNKVDEIIIVDTGSTDQTKEIAKNFTPHVFEYEWQHDFSKARNFAMKKASYDWILQLDADEFFTSDNPNLLKDVIRSQKSDAYSVLIQNMMSKGAPVLHRTIRLFRRTPAVSYVYRIHEQPMVNIKPFSYIHPSDITITHIGYQKEVVEEKNKRERNVTILLETLQEHPKDAFLHFNLGNEYLALGDNDNAIKSYEKAISLNRAMYKESVLRYITAFLLSKRYYEAEKEIIKAKRQFSDYPELYLTHGELLFKQGRYKEAEKEFLHCLDLHGNGSEKTYISQSGSTSVVPLTHLSQLYLRKREFNKLLDVLLQLIYLNKNNEQTSSLLVELLKKSFQKEEIIQILDECYRKEIQTEYMMKVEWLRYLRYENEFLIHYRKIRPHVEEKIRITYDFYEALFRKEYTKAKQNLVRFDKEHQDKYALLYYVVSGDETVYSYLQSTTADFLFRVLREENQTTSAQTLSESLYIETLKTLEQMGEYEAFEKLLQARNYFEPSVYKHIGSLFYQTFHDELAIDFYATYVEEHPDDVDIMMGLTNLLHAHGYVKDALIYATKAVELNTDYARGMEIKLEILSSLNQKEEASKYALLYQIFFPHSTYFASFVKK